MRVNELARELGITSKDLLARLRGLGVEVKSHSSSIDPPTIELARKEYAGEKVPPAPAAEPVKPPPEPAKKPAPPEPKASKTPARPAPAKPKPPAGRPPEPAQGPAPAERKVLKVRGAVVVKDLAEMMDIRPNKIIAELMQMNVLASINQRVDVNVARKIAEKHGFSFKQEKRIDEHRKGIEERRAQEEAEEKDRPEDLLPRPPVVTFLGHVDHGKTSLLDYIRKTAVAKGEHGGITQHIGAYTIEVGGRSITFLDTPGHAAFTAMRARGANLTDIAVIVIAADDGVMPQTEEAIRHAQAAGVTLMVAINKIDLTAANVDRVKKQLQQADLTPEDWGGDVICAPVSAVTGKGIDHLLEMILLQADMLELTANPKRRADGFVIEAQQEAGKGPVATLLVKRGTLKLTDPILCGTCWGRARALVNDHGANVKSAGPSTPVKCLGLSGVPEAGARFTVGANERIARDQAVAETERRKREQLSAPRKASLDALLDQLKQDEKLELRVILKADTHGSVEAILHALEELRSEKVSLRCLLSGTGNITENDVMLGSASDAVILGFHVAREPGVDAASRHEGVEIRLHQVIYELIDEVRDAMSGLLEPFVREEIRGHAEIRKVFPLGKRNKVAGCFVRDGAVTPAFKARVKRADEVLYEGTIASLKHFQDDVAEVREGQECGIRLDRFIDFDAGDTIEFYTVSQEMQTL